MFYFGLVIVSKDSLLQSRTPSLGAFQISRDIPKSHKEGLHLLYHEGATFGNWHFGLQNPIPTRNALILACQHQHIKMDMHLTRKIFASWLRKEGIAPEIVDLLQGRVSQSILTRHYLAPSQNMKDDMLKALEKLQKQLG